jgi:diguanylate cyclase (GGDEF)-like protein/putative nucleotidyltransferase with HDIG domain
MPIRRVGQMTANTWKVNTLVAVAGVVGLGMFVLAGFAYQPREVLRFACYLALACSAAGMKVRLPGVTGTMSVNFVFILIGVLEMSILETLFIGCLSCLLQCFWNAKKPPTLQQLIFNVGSMAVAVHTSYWCYFGLRTMLSVPGPFALALASIALFAANTLPVAMIISLSEGKPVKKIWSECYFWSFPFYIVGGCLAGLFDGITQAWGWPATLLMLPLVYWIYRSYRLYLERLEQEKEHAVQMSNLHLRTIEALALAIDAKDHTTHEHLSRVQVYAVEIGKEMNLSAEELEALRAASLLHDIGKLAVPEHIISKPGRLTPEEFDKMKIHPVVGAEILERVQFPYPVVPIVRCHHEKWDGSGYPDGLSGEAIPLGARILSAVDCLDALASDRQYRPALPLDAAMQAVIDDSGRSFDPQVVDILKDRYLELEQKARLQRVEFRQLTKDLKIPRGLAPDAGFEDALTGAAGSTRGMPANRGGLDFLTSIASARQEVQAVFELTNELGSSLQVDETLSFLDVRLKRIIPYDAIAVYVVREGYLIPEFVNGDNSRLFAALEIPVGEGLSGWVAQNNMSIVNGNPSVEPGYLHGSASFSTLRSALAVPLEGATGVVGVLAIYHREKDAFTKDQLRVVQAISHKVAMSIENALRFRLAEKSATTDGLTGLPNARSLFLHLDSELARCKREGGPLSILVCDLDGFKSVNDKFGHLEGNRVLQLVAQALRESCRTYDYVARMGGDEFVVVLPLQEATSMRSKVERLVGVVEEVGRRTCPAANLSLSIGAASFPDDGYDAEQLLAEADRRMYKNKASHKASVRVRFMPSEERSGRVLVN